ncbi:MAG TPA: GNAT family N-acetyltransferase [Asticcacaulis sp.]|nr:GNAT family N-acetyltransferase [Asticcacaulis sp.]
MDIRELDNPAWAALNGRHAHLAQGEGAVKRYPADVSPFSAIAEDAGLPALAEAMTPGDNAVIWATDEHDAPDGLELVVRFPCLQMVAFDARPIDTPDDAEAMTAADAPAMQALAVLTKPGPFGLRTIEMGSYVGVRHGREIVAMAGERMKPDRFTEVSAICVHPDHQGKGHARRLTSIMMKRVLADGRVPFLNVLPDNRPAIALYESLGFAPRRLMQVHLFSKPGGDGSNDPYFRSL